MDLLAGVVLFFAIDALVFRSGFYARFIEPVSKDGSVARSLYWPEAPAGNKLVMVVGDSRIGEGFSARLANQRAAAEGAAFTFVNSALPSSNMRTWYLMLREHIARGHRPAIVVLMAPSYRDDELRDLADWALDPGLGHTLLRLGDVWDYPWTFPSWSMRAAALRAILLSGYEYKTDLAGFLAAPRTRLGRVAAERREGQGWVDRYDGRPDRVAAKEPACETDAPSPCAAGPVLPPDNEKAASYQSYWMTRISGLCREAGLRLVMIEIPRGPYHHGDGSPAPRGSLADLAAAGALELLPAEAFRDLERPRYFFDDLHLNTEGRRRFSTMLADRIIALPAATLPAAAR